MLRAIGDLADRLADVLTVVAIAIAVVAAVALIAVWVMGTAGAGAPILLGLTGFAANAWAAAGSWFVAAGWAKLAATGAKAESKLLYHDPDLAWSQLVKDGALAGLTIAGGPVKAAQYLRETRAVSYVMESKAVGQAYWKLGNAALSGNRVARFPFRTADAWNKYQAMRQGYFGTKEAPKLLGVLDKIESKGEKIWFKHRDDPLGIFHDPIKTSPGPPKEPDGTGVWVRDFGRAILQL